MKPTLFTSITTVCLLGMLLFAACQPSDKGTTTGDVQAEQTPPVVAETPPTTDDSLKNSDVYNVYENTDRVAWQRPDLIIGLLSNGSLKNKTVADIGAGNGFFSKRITPFAAKVIALDIEEQFLHLIDSTKMLELPVAQQSKLETRLTPRNAPNLQPDEVDAVLIVNTFMYFENQLDYLLKLKPCIKKGGRLVIVDFKRKRTDIGPQPRSYRTPLYVVEDLLYEAGYNNIQAIDTELNYQYIVIAER
ncbi:MAG: DUF1698 domain-containing protein [Saprospiraceae bacterium]